MILDKNKYSNKILDRLEEQYNIDDIDSKFLCETINDVIEDNIKFYSDKENIDWQVFDFDIYLEVIDKLGLEE